MPISKGEIAFNAEAHEYTNKENGRKYMSATQLLKKHGLAADYSAVPTKTLALAAERGTYIHGEIERYIKNREAGFTSELSDFIDICEDNGIKPNNAEFIVYNDEYGIAGTVDLSGLAANNRLFIGDVKTTSTLHTEALSWQLGLYAYLGEMVVSEAYGFHLRPKGKSKLVKVRTKTKEQVEALLEADKRGEIYAPPKAVVQIANEDKLVKLRQTIVFHKQAAEQAEKELEEMKGFLIKAMSANNIKKLESDRLSITYIAPGKRTTINGVKLREDFPDLVAQYSKTSDTKETVRITLRGEDESEG